MKSEVTFELKGDILYAGFKPLVWRLASAAHLAGWVSDSMDGVMLNLIGKDDEIEHFMLHLPDRLEPAFRLTGIRVISRCDIENQQDATRFRILEKTNRTYPEIRPDFAPCPECLAEMNDPSSRRYCYPFFSCKKCGSFYSALKRSPFKRVNTYFSAFPPCHKCADEKRNEHDTHHFGSEFLSCPDCGPRLILIDNDGNTVDEDRNICLAREFIAEGKILALQSMFGSFRLYADAFNASTIADLRLKRKIPSRPIAVTARDMSVVKKYFVCSDAEEALLSSGEAPIVVLRLRDDIPENPSWHELCMDGAYLGVSLPQTMPIHLLFSHTTECCSRQEPFELLASVSGRRENVSHDADTELVYETLRDCADYFLCHDLRIGIDCIPSVAAVHNGATRIKRRSRGYTPSPVILPQRSKRIAAGFGSDLNSSVALAFGNRIIQSHDLGENLTLESATRSANALEHLCGLFDAVPDAIACDMNQNLMTSIAANEFADRHGLPIVMVQTHHAHALSCMAEHGLERAIALVFGEGVKGPDGNFWGSELMEARLGNFLRLGSFAPASVPGRDSALARPARQFAGRLLDAGIELTQSHLEKICASSDEAEIWRTNCAGKGRVSKTHAAFRLFDAMAVGLGFAPEFIGYRSQSIIRLEYAARDAFSKSGGLINEKYKSMCSFKLVENDGFLNIDWIDTFRNLFSDPALITKENAPDYALAFHASLAESILAMAEYAAAYSDCRDVVLSGGCFMSGLLSTLTEEKLNAKGFKTHLHRLIPPNEEGLASGQAYHAAFGM